MTPTASDQPIQLHGHCVITCNYGDANTPCVVYLCKTREEADIALAELRKDPGHAEKTKMVTWFSIEQKQSEGESK